MSLIEKAKSGIVLDGAMSDELENQGVNTNERGKCLLCRK